MHREKEVDIFGKERVDSWKMTENGDDKRQRDGEWHAPMVPWWIWTGVVVVRGQWLHTPKPPENLKKQKWIVAEIGLKGFVSLFCTKLGWPLGVCNCWQSKLTTAVFCEGTSYKLQFLISKTYVQLPYYHKSSSKGKCPTSILFSNITAS